MNMYKKAYQELLYGVSEVMDMIDEVVMESEPKHMREKIYELYGRVVIAIQNSEKVIVESDEEI